MPTTESFDTVFANNRKFATITTVIPSANVIETWKDTLTSVGWTLTTALSANGAIVFPFGLPITTGTGSLTTTANCLTNPPIMGVNGINFSFYNPVSAVPAPNVDCVMVPAGTTSDISLANLAVAVSGATPYTAFGVGSWTLSMVADAGGGFLNFPRVPTDGRWAEGSPIICSGGYKLTSEGVNASQFSTTLIAIQDVGAFNGDGIYHFEFDFNGIGTETMTLQVSTTHDNQIGPYNILANENQFMMYDPTSGTATDAANRASAIFACAPFITSAATYAAFVIDPTEFRFATTWGNTNFSKIVALDNEVSLVASQQGYPKVLAFYPPPGTTLLTPQGVPIVICPYIGYAKNDSGDTPAVVGKIWDALILSDQNLEDSQRVNGFNYKIVCQDDGSGSAPGFNTCKASLLFRFE
jgi:hypothetical protein